MRKILSLPLVAVLSLLLAVLAGCGVGVGGDGPERFHTDVLTVAPFTLGTPSFYGEVTDNILQAASSSEVAQLIVGQQIGLRTNDRGQTVTQRRCIWLGTVNDAQLGLLFWGHSVDQDIGPGYSGSVMVAEFGGQVKTVGVLAYGWGGNPRDFLARPAQSLLELRDLAYRGLLKEGPRTRLPNQRPERWERCQLAIEGWQSRRTGTAWLRGFAARASRYQFDNPNPSPTAPHAQTPAPPAISEPISSMSIHIPIVEGDLINGGIVGTMSFVFAEFIRAFGHGIDETGTRNLPVYLANVLGLGQGDDGGVFKKAERTTLRIGDLVDDRKQGVTISRGTATAPLATMTVTSHTAGPDQMFRHTVANDYADLTFVQFLVIAISFDQVIGDPVGGTGTVTMLVTKGGRRYTIGTNSSGAFIAVELVNPADPPLTQTVTDPGDLAAGSAVAIARVLDAITSTTPGQYESIEVTAAFTPSPSPSPSPTGTGTPSPTP